MVRLNDAAHGVALERRIARVVYNRLKTQLPQSGGTVPSPRRIQQVFLLPLVDLHAAREGAFSGP